MGECSFPWLLDGKPFEMPSLVINGHRELTKIRQKYSKTLSAQMRMTSLSRMSVILGIRRILEVSGAGAAKKAWDTEGVKHFTQDAWADMEWPVEQFADCLEGWVKYHVLENLGVDTIDQARELIKKEVESASAEIDANAMQDYQYDALLVEMEWRLKRVAKSVQAEDGEIPLTRDSLAAVVTWPEDATRFYAACHSKTRKADPEIELATPDEAALTKN